MNRLLLSAVAAGTMIAGVLGAQPPPGRGGDGSANALVHRRGARMERIANALVEVLDLSEAQTTAFQELRQRIRSQAHRHWEEQGVLREQMRTALDTAAPDPQIVGELAIALRNSHQRFRELKQDFENGLLPLLDEGQRQRYEILRQALEELRPDRGARIQRRSH